MKGPFWVIMLVGIVLCSYGFSKMLDHGASVEQALGPMALIGAFFVMFGLSASKCRTDEKSGRAEQRRREKAYQDHVYATSHHHSEGGRLPTAGEVATVAVVASILSDD